MAQNDTGGFSWQSHLHPPSTNGTTTPSTPSRARKPILRQNSNGNGHGTGGIVVFSGGSAANNLVDVFEHLRAANHTTLRYIIPISDNGGSSSELIRVFGGPGIGDVRSRLVRLIPDEHTEAAAIKLLFNHRLPKEYNVARLEWLEIVDGTHEIWQGISSPKRELIRSILNTINLEVVKRMRPSSRFDFGSASVGNLFLTGARLFTGSFEAAIYLLSSICAVPESVQVLPVLNTNFAHHIAAGLEDGSVITGQNSISHPSVPTAAVPVPGITVNTSLSADAGGAGLDPLSPRQRLKTETEEQDKVEDANLPGTLPSLRKPAITFSKEKEEDLPCRIQRLWYINPYGQEIRIPANPRVLEALDATPGPPNNAPAAVIYSIGSLFTSLISSLVLRGVGAALANPAIRSKILILNGTLDRETGPPSKPFTAMDFVDAIASACADSQGFSLTTLNEADRRTQYGKYITHVIYLDSAGAPAVDRADLASCGIDAIRLYGPGAKDGVSKGGRYDVVALRQALEAIVGRRDPRADRSRRNTLVG